MDPSAAVPSKHPKPVVMIVAAGSAIGLFLLLRSKQAPSSAKPTSVPAAPGTGSTNVDASYVPNTYSPQAYDPQANNVQNTGNDYQGFSQLPDLGSASLDTPTDTPPPPPPAPTIIQIGNFGPARTSVAPSPASAPSHGNQSLRDAAAFFHVGLGHLSHAQYMAYLRTHKNTQSSHSPPKTVAGRRPSYGTVHHSRTGKL